MSHPTLIGFSSSTQNLRHLSLHHRRRITISGIDVWVILARTPFVISLIIPLVYHQSILNLLTLKSAKAVSLGSPIANLFLHRINEPLVHLSLFIPMRMVLCALSLSPVIRTLSRSSTTTLASALPTSLSIRTKLLLSSWSSKLGRRRKPDIRLRLCDRIVGPSIPLRHSSLFFGHMELSTR